MDEFKYLDWLDVIFVNKNAYFFNIGNAILMKKIKQLPLLCSKDLLGILVLYKSDEFQYNKITR